MIPLDYNERVYAGILGKCVGVRLGAPVESVIWTYERIREVYKDSIHGYLRPYTIFGADDDINGPVYFFLPLMEKDDPTLQDFGLMWLDAAREEKGFFWWGGVGQSTSHTVYALLKRGEKLPIDQAVLQGAKHTSESIGGQIFVDFLGMAFPGREARAAEIGGRLAAVAHYGEGVYGGRFMAAAVAAAFDAKDVSEVLERALAQIPRDSDYARVVRRVMAFHEGNPGNWRSCMEMLIRDWGYGRYTGICPMIPNAGVCALALLYGEGDFNRTVETAVLCGWDTDCNAGSVGAVAGVLYGLSSIDECYLEPFHDVAILSGVSGDLNICDLAVFSRMVARRGRELAGERPAPVKPEQSPCLDFELPRSTHGFMVSDPFVLQLSNSGKRAYTGSRSLMAVFNRLQKGSVCRVFVKTFYTRREFNDGRYSPVFSPKAYPGQRFSLRLYMEKWTGTIPLTITPYVRTAFEERIYRGSTLTPENNAWTEISMDIPDCAGELIGEAGLIVEAHSVNTSDFASRDLGRFFMDDFQFSGFPAYEVDFSKCRLELGSWTPFSHNRGRWEPREGRMEVSCEESCQSFAGRYNARNIRVSALVQAREGGAGLIVRAKGTARHVWCGLLPGGRAGILIGGGQGYEEAASAPFDWDGEKSYRITAKALGNQVRLEINGAFVAAAAIPYEYGMFGMGLPAGGAASFAQMRVEELPEEASPA